MMIHRLGMHVTDRGFWDVDLTENEIGIICGVLLQVCHLEIMYEVEDDNNLFSGIQTANSSWWPTASHWENEKACGLNLGHWTQWDDEHWY